MPRTPAIDRRLRIEDLLSPELLDGRPLPTDRDLPCSDDEMESFHQWPADALLSEPLMPILAGLWPPDRFILGGNVGIYYDVTVAPLDGCKAPDLFVVVNCDPLPPGRRTPRSYVLWRNPVSPLFVFESASGNGEEERDRTPRTGKFWVYERAIRSLYYGIFQPGRRPEPTLEMYKLSPRGRYRRMVPNRHGHYRIPELGVALGMWQGTRLGVTSTYARWYTLGGELLPIDSERAEAERIGRLAEQAARDQAEARADDQQTRADRAETRADRAETRAERAEAKARKLAERLRKAGIDLDE